MSLKLVTKTIFNKLSPTAKKAVVKASTAVAKVKKTSPKRKTKKSSWF